MRTNTGRRYVVPLVWLFCVLTSVIFLQPKVNAADSWNSVGTPGFSNPTQFLTSAMDGDTPYVAFRDWGNGYKLSVMKYNGSTWEFVGSPAFYSGADVANSIVIHAGVPYVGFADGNNGGKATVMRFNGSSWEFVGSPGFSIGDAGWLQLNIANNGTPYVAFSEDIGVNGSASVMKYDGGSWSYVGARQFTGQGANNISLEFDNNTPYISFSDISMTPYRLSVMRFNGSSWEFVGSPNFNTHSIDNSLYGQAMLKINNHTPYVVFRDLSMYSVSVMR